MAKRRAPGKGKAGGTSQTPSDEQVTDNWKDHQAYEVARMLCERGLSASRIAQELYKEEYKARAAQVIMRVKRLLQHALERGLLQLHPPDDTNLSARLQARFPAVAFHVVKDDPDFSRPDGEWTLDPNEPVFLEASRLIAEELRRLLREKPKAPENPAPRRADIFIGIAGGPTVSNTLRHLRSEAAVTEHSGDHQRLLFLSLNAARTARESHLSANFLAVRMADLYGAGHFIPLFDNWSELDEGSYRQAVADLDLLICGAGTRDGLLFRWYRKLKGMDIPVPEGVVGDIAFIPIDARGRKATLDREVEEELERKLRPRPVYEELQNLLTRNRRVLLILARPYRPHPHDEDAAGWWTAEKRQTMLHSKARVARAVLGRPLVNQCVLGTSLAREILSE